MSKVYITDKVFDKSDFAGGGFEKASYENCTFLNCDFTGVTLAGSSFEECNFSGCNLSNVPLAGTAIRGVAFKNCKMLGLRFYDCNEYVFKAYFQDCNLSLSSFYRVRIKEPVFSNCQLQETDFTETDLTNAVFDNCDLSFAVFDNTILERADLRTAYNYTINPTNNKLKAARFSTSGLAGLLGGLGIIIE